MTDIPEFTPRPSLLAFWRRMRMEPATDADVAMLEERLGAKAPPRYVAFMKTYGSVEFSIDESDFFYLDESNGTAVRRRSSISFIKTPAKALRYYDGLQSDPEVDLPPHLLPFAMDRGQGELLVEFGRPTERIYYWNFAEHDWGSGVTRLSFVADDVFELVAGVRPWET